MFRRGTHLDTRWPPYIREFALTSACGTTSEMNIIGTLPSDKQANLFLEAKSGGQDSRANALWYSRVNNYWKKIRKKNKLKVKSTRKFNLNKCINRKLWALLKSFLGNFKSVLKNTYSCWWIDLDHVRLSRVRGRARGAITRESLREKTDLAHLQAREIYRTVFPSVTRHN
jgi:hypothetical protein